jgi:hypothetical protein
MSCMMFIKLITIHVRLKKMQANFLSLKALKKDKIYKIITALRMQAHYAKITK